MSIKGLKALGVKGSGYFCHVKRYHDIENDTYFAVKELKKKFHSNEEYRYRFNREIELIKSLQDCPHVIELISVSRDKNKPYYVMPYATSNLYDYIKRNNNTISKEIRYKLTKQIIRAIEFAHNRGILHRDISPTNVLVFEHRRRVTAKVCDYGLGKDKKSISYYTKSSTSGYGQILYVSPEQRNKLNSATFKSDIYSLGKLVYFIFTGKDPDNQKPFELSSLVIKATEENPESRFTSILEFKKLFNSLQDLMLNQKIPDGYITLKDIVKSGEDYNWLEFHQLVREGRVLDHVYNDYLEPVINILSNRSNLHNYYAHAGSSIREGIDRISERLYECYQLNRWPFNETRTFGKVLKLICQEIPDSHVRLICLKQLWHLAYNMDQWAVKPIVKEVFNSKIISPEIEAQLSEYISSSEKSISISTINSIRDLPRIVKIAMIKSDEAATRKELKTKAEKAKKYKRKDWNLPSK